VSRLRCMFAANCSTKTRPLKTVEFSSKRYCLFQRRSRRTTKSTSSKPIQILSWREDQDFAKLVNKVGLTYPLAAPPRPLLHTDDVIEGLAQTEVSRCDN